MKKLHVLLLLMLALLCLFSTAFAASIYGQQSISYITDENGYVTSLTDDQTSTAWTKSSDDGVDLTLHFYNETVGEIWIRNGHAYSTNYYNHYDRAATVKVTVHYYANRYTTSYDTYRYSLTDSYRPNTMSKTWNSGYQRLLLPKKYTGVTQIELTIENAYAGYGRTGATISDIIVAAGNHATATPKSYATATPKPYVVYITPTPGPVYEEDEPLVELLTPIPEDEEDYEDYEDEEDDLVIYITPRPTKTPTITVITAKPNTPGVELITPRPTNEPLVELITPVPEPAYEYPTETGVIGFTNKQMYTRYGPTTGYGSLGTFFKAGQEIKVVSKVWDNTNTMYWYQVEFLYEDEWYRAYTNDGRIDVADPELIPDETPIKEPLDVQKSLVEAPIYNGPGLEYNRQGTLGKGKSCPVYNFENGWVQVEYFNYGNNTKYRGWVPMDVIYGE